MTASNKTIHQGRNVKRFREMLGIKQDALAADLGRRLEPAKGFAAGVEGDHRHSPAEINI